MTTNLFDKDGGITAHRLGAAIRFFKTHPQGEALTGIWTDPRWKADDFFRWFREKLEAKINARDPRFPKGRKTSLEYKFALIRMGYYRGNRIVIDYIDPQLGPRVKAAFAHRWRHRDCVNPRGHVCHEMY